MPLLSGSNWGTNVSVQGFEAGPDTDTQLQLQRYRSGLLPDAGHHAARRPRIHRSSDGPGAPKVAIVNEAFARKFNLGRDAVGRWMKMGSGGTLDTQIVGLVQDAKYSEVKSDIPALFFMPGPAELVDRIDYVLRPHRSRSRGVLRQDAVGGRALDPNLPVDQLRTMEMQIRRTCFWIG